MAHAARRQEACAIPPLTDALGVVPGQVGIGRRPEDGHDVLVHAAPEPTCGCTHPLHELVRGTYGELRHACMVAGMHSCVQARSVQGARWYRTSGRPMNPCRSYSTRARCRHPCRGHERTPRSAISATARSNGRLAMPARWWPGATAISSTSPTVVASSSVQRTATKPTGTPPTLGTHTSTSDLVTGRTAPFRAPSPGVP